MSNKHRQSLSDDELLRYSRQILLQGWDIEAQERLKASRVLIVGAGGLGCPAAETLARAGVGHMYIIDDDVVEASNLQRQTLFTPEDIGQCKAQTAQQALQKINPFITVKYSSQRLSAANARAILQSAQMLEATTGPLANSPNPNSSSKPNDTGQCLLVDCSDNFAVRELLNGLSVHHNLPLLSASAIAMTGQLALYEPYKNSGCYHCVFGSAIARQGQDDTPLSAGLEEAPSQNCANSGVLASTTTVMGNLQANLALQFLGLGHNPLHGQLLIWQGSSMTQNLLRYRQDKACPICALPKLPN